MTVTEVRHPAQYSKVVMDALAAFIEEEAIRRNQQLAILDPFAGMGNIHYFQQLGHLTYGVEIEKEWARSRPGTIVGDATAMSFHTGTIDVVATSPCYGNRMADHHDAQERCKVCGGRGFLGQAEETESCEPCGGLGRRDHKRNTYRHSLGRPLTEGSAAKMQWGDEYRKLHTAAWIEVLRVLRKDGLFLLNISNHIRKGVEQRVTEWHVKEILSLGFRLQDMERIVTPRFREGANAELRCENEFVIAFRSRV